MTKEINFAELSTVHINLEPDGVTIRGAQLESHLGGDNVVTRMIDIHVNKLNILDTNFDATGIVAEVTILARVKVY